MNRIQFFVLTGLSSLVVLFLIGHIFLVRQINIDQGVFSRAQQEMNQGQAFQANLKQLAVRIFQDSQKTQDPALKELLDRQQIKYTPAAESTNATPSPASPAPSTSPATR